MSKSKKGKNQQHQSGPPRVKVSVKMAPTSLAVEKTKGQGKGKGQPNAKKGGSVPRIPSAPRAQAQPKPKLKAGKREREVGALWQRLRTGKFKTVDLVFLTEDILKLGKKRVDLFVPAHSWVVRNSSRVLNQLIEEQENLGKDRKVLTTEEEERSSGIPAGTLVVGVPRRRKLVLKKVLRYIYTGRVHSTYLPEFLTMAKGFGLEESLEESWDKMRTEALTEQNATKMFDMAFWQEDRETMDLALEFIERNASLVLASRGFSNMSKSTMERILVSDELCVDSEMEVFKALIRWLRSRCKDVVNLNPKQVAQQLGTTTNLVRYSWIPLKELLTDVRKSGVLSEDHWVQVMLTREDPTSNPLGLNLKMRKGFRAGNSKPRF